MFTLNHIESCKCHIQLRLIHLKRKNNSHVYKCFSTVTCKVLLNRPQRLRTLNTLSQELDHPDYRVSIIYITPFEINYDTSPPKHLCALA